MLQRRALARDLGTLLDGVEAEVLAYHLSAGETLAQALACVDSHKRGLVDVALGDAGIDIAKEADRETAILILEAIYGASLVHHQITPVWTTPAAIAKQGDINTFTSELVSEASHSVVCSTFNFQRSSALWRALKDVLARKDVMVKIYMDTNAADGPGQVKTPSTFEVAREFESALVFRTKELEDGTRCRNHAKFISIDQCTLLVTSANFSWSAEESNVELGLRIEDQSIARMVETQMEELEPLLYERVR